MWPGRVLVGLFVLLAVVAVGHADILRDIVSHCPAQSPSFERVIADARALQASPRVQATTIGASRQGRPLLQITVRDPEVPLESTVRVFIIARQHGTESSGTTACLALARHFANSNGEMERALLRQLTWVLVPVANPDGMAAGRRTNAAGADLNRSWAAVSQPEIRAIIRAVEQARPHALIDMHELPAQSSKAAYRDNFIQTIGPSSRLPGSLGQECKTASARLASWMGQVGYPLSVYYDTAEEDTKLCHRYFGLARKIPSYLFEAKTGGGRSLLSRTRFHVLGALVVADSALHRHYAPAEEPRVAAAPPPNPPEATGPPVVELEQPQDRATARGELNVVAKATPAPAYLQLQVDGVVKALASSATQTFPLNTRAYPDGEHRIVVQACDDYGRVLAEAAVTVLVDNQQEAGE